MLTERQLIDTLDKVNDLSDRIVHAIEQKDFNQVELTLIERLEVLKLLPPLESLNLSPTVFQQSVAVLKKIESTDSIGLKNAVKQRQAIQNKLSAGLKAQKAIDTYLDNKF